MLTHIFFYPQLKKPKKRYSVPCVWCTRHLAEVPVMFPFILAIRIHQTEASNMHRKYFLPPQPQAFLSVQWP